MNDFKKDKVKAMELYEEIKIQRRCRNHQHKLIRAVKKDRDVFINEVKELVSKVQQAKADRDDANTMAKEFKALRDDAITNLRAAKKINDRASHKRFDKAQEGYHAAMLEKTEESQKYQIAIEELNLVVLKTNKKASDKHDEMLGVHKKAQKFHDNMIASIRAVDMIKEKHGIDFIEYNLGEEE
jgi:uncharacterized coiled-coil DUF342 family protein